MKFFICLLALQQLYVQSVAQDFDFFYFVLQVIKVNTCVYTNYHCTYKSMFMFMFMFMCIECSGLERIVIQDIVVATRKPVNQLRILEFTVFGLTTKPVDGRKIVILTVNLMIYGFVFNLEIQ